MTVIRSLMIAMPLMVYAGLAESNEKRYTLALPAQPISTALESLARQTGIKPFWVNEITNGKQSNAIEGEFTVRQAMDKLLAGTGLVYSASDEENFVIKAAQPETTLPTVTVEERYKSDRDDGYVQLQSVSATRTDTPIKAIPQSVQVIKRSLLDDQQSVTITEALKNVSGVTTNTAILTPSFDQTRIRGFKAEQLVDGFTQYYNPGDRESTVNIDTIEVLKGTNGVLYSGGSGSPVGGVVNINSKRPTVGSFGEVGFKIGTQDYYQPYVDINKSLHDNVLFRFAGEYTNAGNYVDTIQTQRYNLNPTITLTNNRSTSLTLQGKVSRWQQPDYQGLPATGTIAGNFKIPKTRNISASGIPDSSSEFNSATAIFDHRFNRIWSINIKARYAESAFDQQVQSLVGNNFSFGADAPYMSPSSWGLVNTQLYQEQQERSFIGNLQAQFDYGVTKNTWLIGADHSDFNDIGFMDWDMMSLFSPNGFIDLADASARSHLPFSKPGLGVLNQFVDNVTYGGYTQMQSTIYDRLHLLASVRIAHVGIDFKNTDPMMANASIASETKPLPRIGAVYDLNDRFSLFINYSEGMRGQPYANFVGKAAPEESTTLEGGLKFDIDKQLTGQIAGYQIDRSHVAVTDYSSPIFAAKAAGQQRSRGVDTDVIWQPMPAWSVLANFAYTDATFTDDLAGVAKGNQLALVPSYSGRLWLNHKFQQSALKGFSLGAGLYAQGEAYLSDNNAFKTDGFHSFDTTLSYEQKRYKVAASIKNLTDENYFLPYGYFNARVMPAEGTAAYVTASVRY